MTIKCEYNTPLLLMTIYGQGPVAPTSSNIDAGDDNDDKDDDDERCSLFMVAYPTSLAPSSPGAPSTPSHGGMVSGHEYDVPISRRSPDPSRAAQQYVPQPLPTQRPTATNGARQRPLSMPMAPAHYAPPNTNDAHQSSANYEQPAAPNGRVPKARSSNRVLGDYTLGKTLGAGSMGKVKLAYHNLTGEKVRLSLSLTFSSVYPQLQSSICLARHQDSSPCFPH